MERYRCIDQENIYSPAIYNKRDDLSVSQSQCNPFLSASCLEENKAGLVELEREIKELEDKKRTLKSVEMLSNVRQKLLKDLSKHSKQQVCIEHLRSKVNSRFKKDHQEPVDLYKMDLLERNSYWDKQKNRKIEDCRKERNAKEMNQCTFKPSLVKSKQHGFSKSNRSSMGTRQSSYKEMHKNKVLYKSSGLNLSFSNLRSSRAKKSQFK